MQQLYCSQGEMILLVIAICWPLHLFYGVLVEIYIKVM